MTITYTVKPYSCYDNWTYHSDTKNVSHVVDKLIRISAKITEYYAGDIVYTINALERAVENDEYYHKVLVFRDGGVNEYDVEPSANGWVLRYGDYIGGGIQVWHLIHDPDTSVTLLTRSYLVSDINNHIVGM